MAQRDTAHQQTAAGRSLVPYVKHHKLPLLPYEKQLIQQLGCTEQQYRDFVEAAYKRAWHKPAGYDHVPEVNAIGLEIVLISLAIGLTASAVSYFLAPKPKAPTAPDRVRQRQLASISGPDRFSPTGGFDSQLELASYNDVLPLIFTKYTGFSGGVLAAGRLVWSRCFSYGNSQGVKLLMLLGEQGLGEGIARPDLSGIFLGSTALDALPAHQFAFYWKRNTNTRYRIKADNLAYGTRGNAFSGDTENTDDIYLCPTRLSLSTAGFCQTFNPSSNAEFGVYSGIANGTDFRVNWKVITIPEIEGVNDDPDNALLLERVKIAGDYGIDIKKDRKKLRNQYQKGTGRGYCRMMGITHINNVECSNDTKETRIVSVGDTAVFVIGGGKLLRDTYFVRFDEKRDQKTVKVDDINGEIDAFRRQADEQLQLGETIMIGRTVWVVINRSVDTWARSQRQRIKLRCIETFGSGIGAQIGIVSNRFIDRKILSDDLGQTNANDAKGLHAGCGFYPLLKAALATVRNTRPCEVTEIGIRSQVWNRANGLCNFASLPTPEDLERAEKNKINLNSGVMNIYFQRTSCFTIFLRPAGAQEDGSEYPWKPLGEQFCVTGEQPVDKYNFIRLTHPQLGQYEFRFIPKSGADVARHSPDDAVFLRLDAKSGVPISADYVTDYGTFGVQIIGERIEKTSITFNTEMASGAEKYEAGYVATIPQRIEIDTYLPDTEEETRRASSVAFKDWLPTNISKGREASFTYEIFGNPRYNGQRASAEITHDLGSGLSITLQYNGKVDKQFPDTSPYFPGEYAWSISSIDVVASSGGFNTGQRIDCELALNNVRSRRYGISTGGVRLEVTRTDGHLPRGRQSAWMHEKLGNAASYSAGYTANTDIATTVSGRAITVNLRATVVNAPDQLRLDFPGVTKTWTDAVYTVVPSGTNGSWNAGEYFELSTSVSSGNPFKQTGTITGVRFRVYDVEEITTPASNTAERIFEENSQINDISFYGNLLTKSNESGPEHAIVYVNESRQNTEIPLYENTTLAGLALKSSAQVSRIEQPRFWLAEGIPVIKFEPDSPEDIGPSNKLVDLIYYLLTDRTAGLGNIISPELIDTSNFPLIAKFHKTYKLFFDGAIDSPINIRQFISDTAPFFLCSFTITNGKFGLIPAVPLTASGEISTTPVTIKQLFTSGNIIQDSFSLEYLENDERRNFQALMRYRRERKNQLPEEEAVVVRWGEANAADYPVENFDLTQFCTTEDHAILLAQFLLSIRRRITHTVKFKTTPYGLDLAPGDYIRVLTESSPYNSANNGIISATGAITSVSDLPDGRYGIIYYVIGNDDTLEGTMTVNNGIALESAYHNAVFSVLDSTVSSNVYMIEQLTLDEEGLVEITASDFPTDNTLSSLIAQDLTNVNAFEVVR